MQTEFKSIPEFAVSDKGEVVFWGYDDIADGSVVLLDAGGHEMWRTKVGKYAYGKGVRFSWTGDEVVVREVDTLTMFRIER